MTYTINNFMMPSGNYQLVITIVGALIGIACGMLVGRYSVFFKMNKKNNFAEDTKYKGKSVPRSKSVGFFFGGFFCWAFAAAVFLACYSEYSKGAMENIGTIVIMAVLFFAFGLLCFITGIKVLAGKQRQ